jgi:dihydroneopterin aldolase
VRLTIDKPGAIPDVMGIGVEIERRREDYAVCGR